MHVTHLLLAARAVPLALVAACFSHPPRSQPQRQPRATPTTTATAPASEPAPQPPAPAPPAVVGTDAVIHGADGTRTLKANNPVNVRLGFEPGKGWVRVVRDAPCDGELATQITRRGSDKPMPWRSLGPGAPLDGGRCAYWIELTHLVWLDKHAVFTIAGARFEGAALLELAGELHPSLIKPVEVEAKTKGRTVKFSAQPVQPHVPTPQRNLYPTISVFVTEPAGGTPRGELRFKAGTITAEAETIGGGGNGSSMTWQFELARADAVRMTKAAKLELLLDRDPPAALTPNPLRALFTKLDKVYKKAPPPPAQPPAASRFDAP